MVRVIARQLSGKNYLTAIFASRHQDASSGPLGGWFPCFSGFEHHISGRLSGWKPRGSHVIIDAIIDARDLGLGLCFPFRATGLKSSGSEKGAFWKRGLFKKVRFLEILETLDRDSREIPESPQSVEKKGESNHFPRDSQEFRDF